MTEFAIDSGLPPDAREHAHRPAMRASDGEILGGLRTAWPAATWLISMLCLLAEAPVASGQWTYGWTGNSFTIGPSAGTNGPTGYYDSSNVPMGSTFYFNSENCTPYMPTVPAYYWFNATARLNLSKTDWPSDSTVLFTTYPSATGNHHCFKSWDVWQDPYTFTIPAGSGLSPGPRLLTRKYYNSYYTGSTNAISLVITVPGALDLAVTYFNILSEATLCAGTAATCKYQVKNYGQLAAANVVLELWQADDAGFSTGLTLVESWAHPLVLGGTVYPPFTTHDFTLPPVSGKKWFRLYAYDALLQDGASWGSNWSEINGVSLKSDIDFVGNGLTWLGPAKPPGKALVHMAPGETFRFECTYRNKGLSATLPTTAIQVGIRRYGVAWTPIQTIPIGSVACQSGPITAGPFDIVLDSVIADEDDIGKKRWIRLNLVNAGEENGYNNNKSKKKTIKIAPSPALTITPTDEPQYAIWEPEGRSSGAPPGTLGNSVGFMIEDSSGGPARSIRCKLEGTSREPGICMNYGAPGDMDYDAYDLLFVKDEASGLNAGWNLPTEDGQVMVTEQPVASIVVTVTARDYGAWSMITAEALDSFGNVIGQIQEGQPIPDDENGNGILDSFNNDTAPGVSSIDDSDFLPVSAHDGDGLTRYEEWRGFMQQGEYVRTSPSTKDLFIFAQLSSDPEPRPDIDLSPLSQLCVVHRITDSEMNGAKLDEGSVRNAWTIFRIS